jgi:hypothetical protein
MRQKRTIWLIGMLLVLVITALLAPKITSSWNMPLKNKTADIQTYPVNQIVQNKEIPSKTNRITSTSEDKSIQPLDEALTQIQDNKQNADLIQTEIDKHNNNLKALADNYNQLNNEIENEIQEVNKLNNNLARTKELNEKLQENVQIAKETQADSQVQCAKLIQPPKQNKIATYSILLNLIFITALSLILISRRKKHDKYLDWTKIK